MMGRIVFVTGGARSGKSRFAEAQAKASGRPVTYLATMQAGDGELAARIEHHRERRPSEWRTIEAPVDIAPALRACPAGDTVLLDCLSLWVSNLLFGVTDDHAAWEVADWEQFVTDCIAAARGVIDSQREREGILIAVSNETGMGIVPADRLTRYYRDALGLVNQAFAEASSDAWLSVSGLQVRLK